MIEPNPPIRLMMPLPTERCSEGVISGINATTGVRQTAIPSSRNKAAMKKRKRLDARGRKTNASALTGAPTRMKGRRRPMRVRVLSDQVPTAGWMKSAAMLSRVMNMPMKPVARRKRSCSITGT